MKNIIKILTVAVCFCFVSVSFAGDVPLTQEQQLVLTIEQLDNTIEYTKGQIEGLKKQFNSLNTVQIRATNQRSAFQKALNNLRAGKKGGKKKK